MNVCVQEYCHFTTDSNRSAGADAWVYHNRDFHLEQMDNRNNRSVHVMFTEESAYRETVLYPPNTINWTMTYKRDSDIFIPYGTFVKNGNTNSRKDKNFPDTIKNPDLIWGMKSSNVTASWMVSRCNTFNRREELIMKARDSGLQVRFFCSSE